MTKHCGGCLRRLPIEAFAKDRSKRDGLQGQCRECQKARFRKWQDELPEHKRKRWYQQMRKHQIKREYGLSPGDHWRLTQAADGKCMACGTEADLCIDHCHTTDEVRGMLCSACNTALGMVKDNPETLERLIDYLAAPPARSLELLATGSDQLGFSV